MNDYKEYGYKILTLDDIIFSDDNEYANKIELNRIQKYGNLNKVYVLDLPTELDCGHHKYMIETNDNKRIEVLFQKGAKKR